MKIDLIGPSFPFRGGISYYTTLLFRQLKSRHRVKFYSFLRQYPNFLYPGRTDRDESLFCLKEEDSQPLLDALNPLSWLRVARKIVEDKAELVIFPWWVSYWAPQYLAMCLFLRAFAKRTRILFICHNVTEHEGNSLKTFVTRSVLSLGAFFVVHSGHEKATLTQLLGTRPIAVVFHPTYEVFDTAAISKGAARAELGIVEDKVLLFFGFVRPYKGLADLIEALPLILAGTKVRLLIVGEFWEDKKYYLRLIEGLGLGEQITIVDRYVRNEEIPLYFGASDLIVLPYRSVTGSGLLQLALGLGKPVVTTRLGDFPKIVLDKKTGFIVPPRDPAAIAAAVLEFYNKSEPAEMAALIREENRRFSWDNLVGAIEGLLPGLH